MFDTLTPTPSELAALDQAEPRPTLEQLRARVLHLKRHQARNVEALERETGVAACIRRARILEGLAALELAVAELQAHPEWRP
jgi:hypothetical protein